MKHTLRFLEDERGQDIIEYSLLIGFIAVASAAAYLGGGNSVGTIWGDSSTQLTNAIVAAS